MSRHELPSGGWIELRDPRLVTERRRRPVREAMVDLSPEIRVALESEGDGETQLATMGSADLSVMSRINDLLAVGLITSASFLVDGQQVAADDLLDLPGADYDAVLQAVAPSIGAFMGIDFDPGPPGDDAARPT